jgi:hypothetical protein
MFVGISITNLIDWYWPVATFLWVVVAALTLVGFLLVPLIEWCCAFTDRQKFHNWWTGWIFDVVWCWEFRKTRHEVVNCKAHIGGCLGTGIAG